jgi:3-phenylpropionate/cinnamic acid dioxygenase small subunit
VSIEGALRELLDREAIRELLYRYCRAVDRRDFAALGALYHADAIDDHTPYFCGPAREFIERLPAIMAANRVTTHHLTNALISVDGDNAEGEICTLVYHLQETPQGPQELLVGGRYLDRYVHGSAGWQFMHRKIVLDWSELRPARFDPEAARKAGAVLGGCGGEDPSRGFFRLLGPGV